MRIKKEGIALALFTALFLSTIALAVDCPVPGTGQTKCYDDFGEITCPSPGEDFYGQDAQYLCNPQSYTTLGGGIMVRDNVTGLIWEVKTDDGSIHDKDDRMRYEGQELIFIPALNSAAFGGYNDWRIPTIKELSTLVDSSIPDPGPTINTTFFPNTVSSGYWSSTPTPYSSQIWIVAFLWGHVGVSGKSYGLHVRAVRAGQCVSFGNFEDNGDGTVTDNSTGLMWEVKADDGGFRFWRNQYTWQEALVYAEDLILNKDGNWSKGIPNGSGAKYDDWRLPNRNELQSLVDYSQHVPSIDTTFFPYTAWVLSLYWSSTTYASDPTYAWLVDFENSDVTDYGKSYGGYVRAVRGGQCGSSAPSCLTEQIYGEHSEETELLRYIRDNVLSQTPEGQEIIKLYYQWSPVIVRAMEGDEDFKEDLKEMIDVVLEMTKGGEV